MNKKWIAAAIVSLGAMTLAACGGNGDDTTSNEPAPADSNSANAPVDLEDVATQLDEIGYDQVAESVRQAQSGESISLNDGSEFALADSIAAKVENGDPINYVFSGQGTSVPLFSAAYQQGFDKANEIASGMLNFEPSLIAPPGAGDISNQISQIESRLNTGQLDCLAMYPSDANAFSGVINKVMAAGVPVFVAGNISESDQISTFTQVAEEEGKTAANTVLDWMERTGNDLKVFAVAGGDPSAFFAQGRMTGFIDTIKAEIPDATFVNDAANALNTTFDPAQTYDAFKALLAGQPDLQFILHVDIGASYADKAIQDAGREGEVFTAGWNLSQEQLDAIEAGVQVALFDQAWPQQAGWGSMACATYLATGEVLPNTQQLIPVTDENLDEGRAELANYGS